MRKSRWRAAAHLVHSFRVVSYTCDRKTIRAAAVLITSYDIRGMTGISQGGVASQLAVIMVVVTAGGEALRPRAQEPAPPRRHRASTQAQYSPYTLRPWNCILRRLDICISCQRTKENDPLCGGVRVCCLRPALCRASPCAAQPPTHHVSRASVAELRARKTRNVPRMHLNQLRRPLAAAFAAWEKGAAGSHAGNRRGGGPRAEGGTHGQQDS